VAVGFVEGRAGAAEEAGTMGKVVGVVGHIRNLRLLLLGIGRHRCSRAGMAQPRAREAQTSFLFN